MRDQENGAPGADRTRDNLLRRQVLYPTELRAHANKINGSMTVFPNHIDHLILLLYTT